MASESDLDLAALAAGAERDPTIDWLRDLAETGFAVPVTLVVGGFLVTGAPVREEHWGAAIDQQVEGILNLAEEHYRRGGGGGEVPEDEAKAFASIRANRLTDALRNLRERRAQRRAEMASHVPEDGQWSPKDLPGDLGVEWAREQGRDRFLTLAGASVLIPPGRREEIGTIRVDIAHIAAWWPARFEATEPDAEAHAEAEAEAEEGGGEEGLAG
jgi:hypothetical protein